MLVAFEFQLLHGIDTADQSHTTARHDSLFNRRPRGVQGVFDSGFSLFHFRFGCRPDIDLSDTAGEFGQPLLEFLAVVITGCNFDFISDLFDSALDGFLAARSFDDDCVVVVDSNLFRLTELFDADILHLDSEVFVNRVSPCKNRNILQHGLSAVAVAGSLDGCHLQDASELIDNQSCQSFALDIFGNNQQRLLDLCDLLEQRHKLGHIADFFLVNEDEWL